MTIKLREGAEGTETASEIADGYRPPVDMIILQPLADDPATFKPRARIHAIALSTVVDPGDDDGRVLSIDGTALTATRPGRRGTEAG